MGKRGSASVHPAGASPDTKTRGPDTAVAKRGGWTDESPKAKRKSAPGRANSSAGRANRMNPKGLRKASVSLGEQQVEGWLCFSGEQIAEMDIKRRKLLAEGSPLTTGWDVFMALLLVGVAVFTPFQISFLEDLEEPAKSIVRVIDTWVDSMFLIDMILRFVMPFTDDQGVVEWKGRSLCKSHSCPLLPRECPRCVLFLPSAALRVFGGSVRLL